MAQDIEEGENPNIDKETRARALNFVARQDQLDRLARLADKSVGSSRVLETPTEAPASRSMTSTAPVAARPVAAAPKTKPPIITKEELEKSGLSLRDYMNKQQGLTRLQDKVNPEPAAAPAARSEVKNTLNDLRAKSKEQQARGAALRAETNSLLGENAAKQQAAFKRSLGVKDFLESPSYAKGGSVSASSYAKGGSINLSNCKVSTAQKNSSSPKW